MKAPVILWFRHDLRLTDNPAVVAAVATGAPIVPVFLWSPSDDDAWPAGAASRVWLSRSLAALAKDLARKGSRLSFLQGAAEDAIPLLVATLKAQAVYCNHQYEPSAIAVEKRVTTALALQGIPFYARNASLLASPETLRTKTGGPFQVFTPFWRALLAQVTIDPPLPAPKKLLSPAKWPGSLQLADLPLLPSHPWAARMLSHWKPGEAGAWAKLRTFCAEALYGYPKGRDRPDRDGVSRLSPHLHFGEISPRQIWHEVMDRANLGTDERNGHAAPEEFLRELGWREFSHHVLFHFPHTDNHPLRPGFAKFPWRRSPAHLRAWQQGQTGYPLVDAGMRELWTTGFMHNRVRMVVASFLVKHLMLSWREGARWFWDTLVDADLAQNSLNWQWSAGCGADAAPYFRIFNPTAQAEKFDPEAAYIRRWVPELAHLSTPLIFTPWNVSAMELRTAGITLGKDYPLPIVDHAVARERALAAFASLRA